MFRPVGEEPALCLRPGCRSKEGALPRHPDWSETTRRNSATKLRKEKERENIPWAEDAHGNMAPCQTATLRRACSSQGSSPCGPPRHAACPWCTSGSDQAGRSSDRSGEGGSEAEAPGARRRRPASRTQSGPPTGSSPAVRRWPRLHPASASRPDRTSGAASQPAGQLRKPAS